MSRKKWVVSGCDRDNAALLAESCGIEPFAAYLLCARGLTDETEAEQFLYDNDLSDPFMLPDMDLACSAINEAVKNGDKITVFGDYDADGVTATALLYSYLLGIGANVDYYIPDRVTEGYGMSIDAVDTLYDRGTKLIITVDNGISAVDECKRASEKGIKVVITDHHRAGEVLPEAVAVVDAHRRDYESDFTDWAGVGIAFKTVSALSGTDGTDLLETYGDLIALGTVADIVPLKGENRILVRNGLLSMSEQLNGNTLRKGIAALINSASPDLKELTAATAAYRLAPRINAAGRMGSADRALRLLLCDSDEEAKALCEEISEANAQRQGVEASIAEAAAQIIENDENSRISRVFVVSGEGWHQGVIGIVASRLTERYSRPVIVISTEGETARGSGRSIEGFSLYEALSACKDLLTQFGGHTLAAGMSLNTKDIDSFRTAINEYAALLPTPVPTLKIDCKLNPASLSLSLLESINILEPFGAENPQPLFGLYKMELKSIQTVSGGKHLRLQFIKNNTEITAMLFSVTPAEFPYRAGDILDLAVRLTENEYMGTRRVSIQIRDIRPDGVDFDKITESLTAYETFCRTGEIDSDKQSDFTPDRSFMGNIFRYIKSNNGWAFDAEVLAYRLGLSESRVGLTRLALDVFSELGLLIYKHGAYILPGEQKKVELESSEIYKKLMEID